MDILKEIDSTLHYENIENAWKKHKYTFVLTLVAIFGSVAGYQAYTGSVEAKSKNDSAVIYNVIIGKADSANYIKDVETALEKVQTTNGEEMLKFELAKTYLIEGKNDEYEKALIELTSAKTKAIKNIATYMLAEFYLDSDVEKALEFTKQVKLANNAFTLPFVQEIEAMALAKQGKTVEAKTLYTKILANKNLADNFKQRVEIKLNQLG
jgi:predicted negative regulator of RcsB-dependent stress response